MFDANDDGSVYSRDSRMPSLVMENGQSMQEYYAQLQASGQLNRNNTIRRRRNSAGSVMSDTERLYGWSGSRGGVSNEAAAPKYRVGSNGKLVLAPDNNAAAAGQSSSSQPRPVLKATRSEGPPAKPRYRPAFAPSADLPSSEDENDEDLDRVIQHDLPTTRPLKPRASLRQKFGSMLARVGSSRKGGSPPPPVPSASTSNVTADENSVSQDQITTIKRGSTVTGGNRPSMNRHGSSSVTVKDSIKEGDENTTPVLHFNDDKRDDSHDDDNVIINSEGGVYQGGFAGLARKLSRRATTGGASGRAKALREERERVNQAPQDKQAAEEMLRNLADIPLHKPPRSAHVPNAKPLSSFPPRAALRTSTEQNSLANAPRYSYYQRPLNAADGPRRRENGVDRAHTTTTTGGERVSRTRGGHNRDRSGSTPSTFSVNSSTGLLPNGHDKVSKAPPVPALPDLPELMSDAPIEGEAKWTKFNRSESATSLATKGKH